MEVVIFIGLQASGKSTFYRARFAASHAYVSKDQFRHTRSPARRQAQLIEEALGAGRSVVVDNTNPTVAARAEIIRLAQAHDATVIGYYFEPHLGASLERNRRRAGQERVPDVALFATLKRLTSPSYTEGFARLYRVRLAAEAGFDIELMELA